MTIEATLIASYALDQKRRGLRPRTILRRTNVLRNLEEHQGRLLDLTPAEIHLWLDAIPRCDRTRYAYISCVSSFFCWAITAGHCTVNPAAAVERPRLHPGLPRPMSAADVGRAAREAPPMIRAWIVLGALAGLRCQEIAGLHREHVWDHETPAMLHVVEGKGGKERVVPLHPEVMTALRMAGLPANGPLFRSATTGRAYHANRVSQIGNLYLRGLGIASTMHQLRHRFGTDFYRASRDIRMTQQMLGHASPVTTAIYTEISPGDASPIVASLTIG